MDVYVWAALGAAFGWALTFMAADKAAISKIESIAAGMFGAVIGGQLQATFSAAQPGTQFHPGMLIGAFCGGIAMLLLLTLFRKAIGPLKPTRKKRPAR